MTDFSHIEHWIQQRDEELLLEDGTIVLPPGQEPDESVEISPVDTQESPVWDNALEELDGYVG